MLGCNLNVLLASYFYSSKSVTNFRSVPSKFLSIHSSILRFTSGLKWFFQSPVWPLFDKRFISCNYRKKVVDSFITFADKCVVWVVVTDTCFNLLCIINRLIFGKFIDPDVIDQLLDLLWCHWFVQKTGNSLDLSPNILKWQYIQFYTLRQ